MIWCLHGFLGRPADWDFLPPNWPTLRPDLFSDERLGEQDDLAAWAQRFNTIVERSGRKKNILLGYSMGGRLALHALTQKPSLWSAAILLSTHPGLAGDGERQERIQSDAAWAEKFKSVAWTDLLKQWNEQAVFGSSPDFSRDENEFDRSKLAMALTAWSLGRQQNLVPALAELCVPILWCAGKNDSKFASLAAEAARAPNSRLWLPEQCGHRVCWERPAEFVAVATQFLQSVTSFGLSAFGEPGKPINPTSRTELFHA